MIDRQPLYPGRVQLTPVAGQANKYDLTMADQPTQAGTPLNKANLLADATAAKFGLTSAAVPNDVFSWLGNFNLHCWRKRTYQATEVKTDITTLVPIQDPDTSGTKTIKIADSISIDRLTGYVSLVNPVSFETGRSDTSAQNLASHAPCYITNLYTDGVYFLPSGSTGGYSNATICWQNFMYMSAYGTQVIAKKVTSSIIIGNAEYVFSANRNAYPDAGFVGNDYYTYTGIPFENIKEIPRVEYGSYAGTGTYGLSNANSLTFSFSPKVVLVYANDDSRSATFGFGTDGITAICRYAMFSDFLTTEYKNRLGFSLSYYSSLGKKSSDGKTFYWYNDRNSDDQMNYYNTVYRYIAIG